MFDIKKFLTENRIPLHEAGGALSTFLKLQREMKEFGDNDLAAYKVDPSYPQYDHTAAQEVERQAKIIRAAIGKLEKLLAR